MTSPNLTNGKAQVAIAVLGLMPRGSRGSLDAVMGRRLSRWPDRVAVPQNDGAGTGAERSAHYGVYAAGGANKFVLHFHSVPKSQLQVMVDP